MDLRQLRYFVVLAEELNFTRAAERCHISQPPFSRAIRDLEAGLGAKLFERDKHRVSITPAGAMLLMDARRILSAAADTSERMQRFVRGQVGTLTIGFGGSTTYSLLPALVRRFRETHPDVAVRYHPISVLAQIEALRDGEIDIGIVRLPIFDELIETRFVHSEPLVVVLPTDDPRLAESGPLPIEAFQTSGFVAYEPTRGYNVHADLLALCRLAGFDPEIRHQAASTDAVVGMVACGEGVAIVPASAERLRIRGAAFRPLAVPAGSTGLATVRFGLAWRRDSPGPTARSFIETTASFLSRNDADRR